MTREQLLDLICPTDVPEGCEDGKSNCDFCFGVMNRWLDEYDRSTPAARKLQALEELLSVEAMSQIYFREKVEEIVKG